MTPARGLALVALALATGARAAPPGAALPASAALPPAEVLARYAAALERLGHPKNLEFDVAIEQVGTHDIEQTHHIYRSGLNERDEITSVDGQPLTRPDVRVLLNRTYRYDVRVTAPKTAEYALTYVGLERTPAGALAYRFATAPHDRRAYAVRAVSIDGSDFLPTTIKFAVTTAGAKGTGMLVYARTDRYWLIREASVALRGPAGVARERLTWTRYAFPTDLPRSTFVAPRALQTPVPPPEP